MSLSISVARSLVGAALGLVLSVAGAAPPTQSAFDRVAATSAVLADALQRFGEPEAAVANRARDLLTQARSAQGGGREADAQRLAGEAYDMLRAGIRTSVTGRADPEVTSAVVTRAPGLSKAYVDRRESALELRAAVLRVAAEKGLAAQGVPDFDGALALADGYAVAGRAGDASDALLRAYEMIKGQLVALRDGETLVRSLSFATPADEFVYEQGRNDAFALLVTRFADAVRDQAQVVAMVDKARTLRAGADLAGSRGEHSQGIRMLEDSTLEYQKVMRRAGILIPG